MKRKNDWHEHEDRLLADRTLRFIAEGKSQLDAFAEVGAQLSRTPGACGFRFNNTLRKVYDAELRAAKQKRLERGAHERKRPLPAPPAVPAPQLEAPVTWEDVFAFLERMRDREAALAKEMTMLKAQFAASAGEMELLRQELERVREKSGTAVQEDYQAFLNILQRARTMGLLDPDKIEKYRRHLDAGGNFERIV